MKKIALILFLSLGINISFAADNNIPDLQRAKTLAEQGYVDAQLYLGLIYDHGKGVKQDFFEAAKWYRLAAEQGNVDAQFNLGAMYDLGKGVKQDYAEAAKWYRLAAEQENAEAQFVLGLLYALGEGIKQDKIEAKRWFRKACNNGLEDGCQALKKSNEAGY